MVLSKNVVCDKTVQLNKLNEAKRSLRWVQYQICQPQACAKSLNTSGA